MCGVFDCKTKTLQFLDQLKQTFGMDYEIEKYFSMKGMLNHALREVRKNVTKKIMMLMEKLTRNPPVIIKETVNITMTKGKGGIQRHVL